MANRRFGGGGQRGGGYHGGQSHNVSPWQGGGEASSAAPNNNAIQTQLALALSSLLQPNHQQMNNAPPPPSLLSLNTSQGYVGNNYPGPGRIGRGRDMRRSEPYNKNRNWRDNKGGGFNKLLNKGPLQRFNNRNQQQQHDKGNLKKFDSNNKNNTNKDEDNKNTDKTDYENKAEGASSDGQGQGNDSSTTSGGVGNNEEKKDRSKYANLPASLLHCFICNKSMWDGESFQNHIGGTAHMQMLNSAEESFRIVVNILRENMRLAEEKEMIELNRMVRSSRKFMHKLKEPQCHCNMCDMKFLGKITAHRKTPGHQRLKRFLHPKCEICALEFPSRIEWVDHRFSPEHLFKVKEVMENKKGGADGNVIQSQNPVQEENVDLELEPLLEESLQSECQNPVLELNEPLENIPNRIPVYKKGRAVATTCLKPANGFVCELCHRFFESEQLSQAHLKTEAHYHNFVTAIKKKAKRAAVEKAENEGKRMKMEKGEEDDNTAIKEDEGNMYDPEDACNEEENDNEEENGDQDMKKEVKTEEQEATGDN